MATLVQIVVTPGSGDGRAVAIARDVRKRLDQAGYGARVQAFRTLGELVQWTRSCPAAFSTLIAIGSDATVSAVAEAAARLSVPFLPVPSGRRGSATCSRAASSIRATPTRQGVQSGAVMT